MNENERNQHEISVTTTFGTTCTLDCHLVPFSVHNEPHLLVMIEDITARKQAEKALHETGEKLRIMFESIGDGVAVVDLAGDIIESNEAIVRMHGFDSKSEYLRRQVLDLIVPRDRERVIANMQKVLEEGSIGVKEYTLFRTDGSEFLSEVSVGVMRDTHGNPTGLISIIRDITARKQAENQITASLKEKEVLLKEIHHRVKNNLQIVSSLLTLQAGTLQDPHVREAFAESQARVKSMALIHEKLYHSPDLARIDFANYVETLTHEMVRSYGAKASQIQLSMHLAPVSLNLDTAIPCGLLLNELVSNALKHAFPAGQAGEIGIALQVADNHVILVVKDTGVGLPPELDVRRTQSLGLTLVMTLVKQLKGSIELKQEEGTAFTIVFTNLAAKAGG